eukprot:jgi/Chrpa1/17179/Chrysochromulina_OHIO_Genome00000990-RA
MGSVSSSDSHTTTPNAVTLDGKTHNKLIQNDRTRCDARHEAGGESLGNFKDDKGPAKSKLYDVAGNPHIDPSGGIGASCLEQTKRIDPRRVASWTSEADDDISLFKRQRDEPSHLGTDKERPDPRAFGSTLKCFLAVSVFLVLLSVVTNLLASTVALWYMSALGVGELKDSSEPTNTVLNEMLQLSSQPILVDRQTEQPVATTAVTFQMNLLNSPGAPFPEPADFDYSTITTLSLTLEDESGPSGFTVMGYKYYNSTDMDFYLTVGYTVHFSRAQGVNQGVLVPGVHIGGDDDARNRRLSSRQLWGAPLALLGYHPRVATAVAQGIHGYARDCTRNRWRLQNCIDRATRSPPPPPRSRFG